MLPLPFSLTVGLSLAYRLLAAWSTGVFRV
jgi:hypothetical protein